MNQIGFVHFQPPNEYNLVTNWSGSPVEFYANVSYNCASSDLHFEADFDQLSWDGAVCLSNGSWQLVENWPSCLKSKILWLTMRGNEPYIVQTTEEKDDVSNTYNSRSLVEKVPALEAASCVHDMCRCQLHISTSRPTWTHAMGWQPRIWYSLSSMSSVHVFLSVVLQAVFCCQN